MFNPSVGDRFSWDNTNWIVVQHPAASGMPYGQEGRAATVFQLRAEQHRYQGSANLMGPGGKVFEVPPDGSALRLGRGPDNEAVLAEAGVSREHGAMVLKDGQVYIWDNSSRNGTFIDGQKIEPQQWVEVAPGSRILLGTPEEGAALALRPDPALSRGLKAFKARFRSPALAQISQRLAQFAQLPGLSVCRRQVVTPETHAALIQAHRDLEYAVIMPWVEGRSWMEMVMERLLLTPEQSLEAARQLAHILATLESRGLAHCDLSGPNLTLEQSSRGDLQVHLVDVEQMFGPELSRPEEVFAGSPGYAHKAIEPCAWSAVSDRFSGAVLLAEMLVWCNPAMAEAAWSESYFEPNELQTLCPRFQQMHVFLARRYGPEVAALLDRAWSSSSPADCASFQEWLQVLPATSIDSSAHTRRPTPQPLPQESKTIEPPPAQANPAPAPQPAVVQAPTPAPARVNLFSEAATSHLNEARKREEGGDLAGAVAAYKQAAQAAGPDSSTAREVALILQELEPKLQAPAPPPSVPPAIQVPPAIHLGAPAPAPAPPAAPSSGKVQADPELIARIRELEGAPGIAPKAPPPPPPKKSQAPAAIAIVVGLGLLGGFFYQYKDSLMASGDMQVRLTHPPAGSSLQGPLTLKARVDNDTGKALDSVTFYLDGKPLGTANLQNEEYQLNWQGKAEPGSHEFKVLARSNTGLERSASVSVEAPHPGTLTLQVPKTAQQSVTLSAEVANPASPITEVIFEMDGKPIGSDKEAPYQLEWTCQEVPYGPMSLGARATLQDGTVLVSPRQSTLRTLPLEVEMFVTLLDGQGKPPIAVKASDLEVMEEGQAAALEGLAPAQDTSILILIDTSFSMKDWVGPLLQAVAGLTDKLRPKVQVCVLTFADQPATLVDFTMQRKKIKDKVSRIIASKGGAHLYDAIQVGSSLLGKRAGDRIMLVLTDSKDVNAQGHSPGSTSTLEETIEGLKRARVSLFALGLGTELDSAPLQQMAGQTGGRVELLPKPAKLDKPLLAILTEIQSRYRLNWNSNNPLRDGSWRKVDFKLKTTGITAKSLPGYHAPRE